MQCLARDPRQTPERFLAPISSICTTAASIIDRSQAGEAPEVLGGGGKEKFVLSSVWSPQTQTRQTKDSLEMCEQHLDFLSPATGLHVLRSCGVRTGHVAGLFVQIPRDLAGKSVRAALWFEPAGVAIQFAGAIESCALGCDAASGNGVGASELDKLFARRARVTVAFGVEGEVGAGERAVGSVGLVEDRDVRGNVFLFDQPGQAVR